MNNAIRDRVTNISGPISNVVICGRLTWLGATQLLAFHILTKIHLLLTIPKLSSASSFIESSRGLTSSYPERGGSKGTVTVPFSLDPFRM